MTQIDNSWLAYAPSDWKRLRVKQVMRRKNSKAKHDNPVVLSLARTGVKVRDITSNEGQLAESYENYNLVEPDDILLNPMDLQSGANCSISRVSGVISPAYVNLRPNNKRFDSRFFDYYFKTQYWSKAFFAYGKGVSYDNRWTLNAETVMNYPILVPDSETQKKVADYIDAETAQIDTLIAKQERLLELLEEKRRATITHAVTRGLDPHAELKETNIPWMPIVPESWSLIKLGYLVKILSGYSPEQAKPKSSGVHPFYKVDSLNSVDDTECITSAKDYVSDSKLVEQPVFIVFPKRGGAIFTNKVAIVKNSACFDTNLMGLRPVESKLLPEFIYHWIKVRTLGELADTSTLPQINNKHIAPLPIGLPPIDEQREIINYINAKNMQTDKLMQKIQTQITLLRERRTSLISHVVTGKVMI